VGMDDSTPIDHPLVSKSIESAQKRVENRNFEIRKHVLEYDDVLNQQREVIYNQRREVLEGADLKENILDMIETLVDRTLEMFGSHSPYPEEWDLKSLLDYAGQLYLPQHNFTPEQLAKMTKEEIREVFLQYAFDYYERKEKELGSDIMRELERVITLRVVDQKWMDHLDAMDQLRQGIGLRAYGHQDPLVQYRLEGYQMFNDMIAAIQEDTVRYVFHVNLVREQENAASSRRVSDVRYVKEEAEVKKEPVRSKKVGRNEPCPCGSGKKYKKCCGAGA